MKNLTVLIGFITLFFVPLWGQETYNDCDRAIELCPNKIYTLNNIHANATVCSNCEDDFFFCFSGKNTIWMKFTTNSSGGVVEANFSNLVFENNPGQGQELQAAIIHASLPCISSSYTLASNCVDSAATNFTLYTDTLPPNTTYYIVVNGNFGTTQYAEATFDIQMKGEGVRRNPNFYISTVSTDICKGNTLVVHASTVSCDDVSLFDWYINGEFYMSTMDSLLVYTDFEDGDKISAQTSCFIQCPDTLKSNTLEFAVHDFQVNAGMDTTIHQGQSVMLQGSASEDSIVWWDSTIHMGNPNVFNPVVNPSQTTTYYLSVSNGYCTITDNVTVFVVENLEVPNSFSPNGDGINDTWEIIGIEDFPDCYIQVFSRWGQRVFQTTGYPKEKRWDGNTRSGKKITEGVYYYVIDLRDSRYKAPLKGTLTIIR